MFEIGRSKRAQQAFAFDDIAIVPSRRTRGEEQVNLTWRIDAFTFEFPLIAAPMDSVMSPATAIEMGRLGGLGVLNLEGLWTRYADPEPLLEEIAAIDDPGAATRRMQELYAEPIKEALKDGRELRILVRERGGWSVAGRNEEVTARVEALGELSGPGTERYVEALRSTLFVDPSAPGSAARIAELDAAEAELRASLKVRPSFEKELDRRAAALDAGVAPEV